MNIILCVFYLIGFSVAAVSQVTWLAVLFGVASAITLFIVQKEQDRMENRIKALEEKVKGGANNDR